MPAPTFVSESKETRVNGACGGDRLASASAAQPYDRLPQPYDRLLPHSYNRLSPHPAAARFASNISNIVKHTAMNKVSDLFSDFLQLAASSQKLGINLIRIAILIIFVWIGGLKFYNYEAEGIVPFVANSPFMSFFYTKSAPEYKTYKLKEGEFNAEKHQWHVENNTYGFSHGLGILIMSIGILVFLGIFSPKIGLAGAVLAIVMTLGTLSFLATTPEVWVPDLGSGEHGFPLLTGAGRLVIKDTAILAGALVALSDSARRMLESRK